MKQASIEICVVAGEASGDAQGALLVRALQRQFPNAKFWGSAGPLMRSNGVESLVDVEQLATMGLVEIISHYPEISKNYKVLLCAIQHRQPDVVIFIDYPGFNLKLLQDVYFLGVTTIYHIPPKAWSHGAERSLILKDFSYLVTSVLPFEVDFFRKWQVPVHFVGNPLRDDVEQNIAQHGNKKIPFQVGILPGSRQGEIKRILPTLIQSFIQLHSMENRVRGRLPIAPTLDYGFVSKIVYDTAQECGVSKEWIDQHIRMSIGDSYDVMRTSSYAWVCSGTAVLETAFFETPMSSFYKMNPLTFWIAKKIIKSIDYVTLVNLCANRLLVPEFLQNEFNPNNLVLHAFSLLSQESAWKKMSCELGQIKSLFPLGAAQNAAHLIANCILKYKGLPLAQKIRLKKESALDKVL